MHTEAFSLTVQTKSLIHIEALLTSLLFSLFIFFIWKSSAKSKAKM